MTTIRRVIFAGEQYIPASVHEEWAPLCGSCEGLSQDEINRPGPDDWHEQDAECSRCGRYLPVVQTPVVQS